MNGHSMRTFLGIVCVVSSVAMASMTFPGNRMSRGQEMSLIGGAGWTCDGVTSCVACMPPGCSAIFSNADATYICSCGGGSQGCLNNKMKSYCVTNKTGSCTDGSATLSNCGGGADPTSLAKTSVQFETVNFVKTYFCVDANNVKTAMGTCTANPAVVRSRPFCENT